MLYFLNKYKIYLPTFSITKSVEWIIQYLIYNISIFRLFQLVMVHILFLSDIPCYLISVARPSESQIPDPAVTSSDPYNDRLSVIRRTSGIRFYLSYALARTYL